MDCCARCWRGREWEIINHGNHFWICEFGPSDSFGSGFCHIITLACRTIHLPFSFQKYITDESRDLSVYCGWRIQYLGPTPFASDLVHALSGGNSTSIRLRTYNISMIVLERAAPYVSIERKPLKGSHWLWNVRYLCIGIFIVNLYALILSSSTSIEFAAMVSVKTSLPNDAAAAVPTICYFARLHYVGMIIPRLRNWCLKYLLSSI